MIDKIYDKLKLINLIGENQDNYLIKNYSNYIINIMP